MQVDARKISVGMICLQVLMRLCLVYNKSLDNAAFQFSCLTILKIMQNRELELKNVHCRLVHSNGGDSQQTGLAVCLPFRARLADGEKLGPITRPRLDTRQ